MKNIVKNYFNNKKGMSLVEVLTAMTIITLVIFCFAPLFLSYLKTITIAGEEIDDVNIQSGIMQTVIGLADSTESSKYSTAVSEVPLSLQANANTTLSRKGTKSAVANTSTATLGTDLDSFKGDLLFSDADNPLNSYITVNGGSTASGLSWYPTSITDDFYKAQILLVADGGVKFSSDVTYSDFEVSVSNAGTLDKSDYVIRPIDEEVTILEFYGGGKVCFENSPLTIKYKSYECTVEIDAPQMIMVGEANSEGEYNYYVSRGEFDDAGNLLIHRRTMNSAPLTSAMNDVEWVSAEDADTYATDSSGNKYGYYVMCGDEGQIRRFWKDSTTGNYSWGGDYTYHTDINVDTSTANSDGSVNNQVRYNSTWQSSLETDFTYVYHGSHTTSSEGMTNVVGGYGNLRVFNSILFSVNALDTDKRDSNTNIKVYIPDGEVYWFENPEQKTGYGDLENSVSDRAAMYSVFTADGDYDNGTIGGQSVVGLNRYWNINLATDWVGLKDNSTYYAVKGQAQDTNMITLTCVDAINMSNLSASAKETGGPYYTVATDGSNYLTSGIEYPTSNYNLYCGYIPAVMDIWANSHSRGNSSAINRSDNQDDYSFYQVGESSIRLDDNAYTADNLFYIDSNGNNGNAARSDFWLWPYWKGTFGLMPYTINNANTINYGDMQRANDTQVKEYVVFKGNRYWNFDIVYYPFTNIGYAPLGKLVDSNTKIDSSIVGPFTNIIPSDASRLVVPQIYVNGGDGYNQQNITGGQSVDITLTYLSHPLAVSGAMNPTDDMVYDMTNNKGGNRVFYWNSTRDATTYLDCASTMVPSGEDDIPVSLLVGYVTGGLAEYTGSSAGDSADNAFINSVFTNGIVLLRAGKGDSVGQGSANFDTKEERAMDNGGYKLNETSNAFHQFYYLNSRTNESDRPARDGVFGVGSYHIGNIYGATFWQNNRHIAYLSVNGEKSAMSSGSFNSDSYEYLRCHPLSNTKVTCVTWGTSWAGNPVAMWGTENGTLLSWKCEINDDNNDGETVTKCTGGDGFAGLFSAHSSDEHSEYHNDRSVVAEFQSYQWIDNVNMTSSLKIESSEWVGTVGSAKPDSGSAQQYAFNSDNFEMYEGFYDACSRVAAAQLNSKDVIKAVGFISTLENINDVEYANDIWIACGDQSDKSPATYCGTGNYAIGNAELGTNFVTRPYITADNYQNTSQPDISKGSWINVNYWIDVAGTGQQSADNRLYQWSAVQISTETDCNIVQINNLNGMWIATGYKDANGNDDYDDGEEARIFWTYDPRIPCGVKGGWSDDVLLYDGKNVVDGNLSAMGGINSCATRSED